MHDSSAVGEWPPAIKSLLFMSCDTGFLSHSYGFEALIRNKCPVRAGLSTAYCEEHNGMFLSQVLSRKQKREPAGSLFRSRYARPFHPAGQ